MVIVPLSALAETSVVLNLQEQLAEQAAAYERSIEKIEVIRASDEDQSKWYEAVLSAEPGSVEHRYAIQKYVSTMSSTMRNR